jgi:hypothetical protein
MEKGGIPTNKTGDVVITLIYEKNYYCLAVGIDVPGNNGKVCNFGWKKEEYQPTKQEIL